MSAVARSGERQLERARWLGRYRRELAAIGVVILLPVAGLVVEAPVMQRLEASAALAWMARTTAMVLLTAALYYHWWVFRKQGSGWLCASAMTMTVFSVPLTLLALSSPGDVGRIDRAARPGIVVAALAIAIMLVAARRRVGDVTPLRPLQIGLMSGAAASGLGGLWWLLDLDRALWNGPAAGPAVVVGLAGLLAAGLLSRVSAPKWFRQPMVAALLFCTASSVLAQWGPGESAGRTAAALGLDVIWTGLVTYSSVRLATFSWSRQLATAEEQARRMVQAEQEVKRDEEMLHELRSTLAGISSAAQLLCLEPGPIDPTRMSHLGRTLTQELARVERLLSPDAPRPAEVVDLAEAIDPVIECARANGQVVRWRPPRIAVFGHPDDIAEAMHALLANARRHAPGSVVKLVTRRRENVVELSVRDAGPGVAGDVGDRLFSRGARGSASVGQGLGLYVARQRLAEHGGGLALAPAPRGGGAEFVLRLPVSVPGEGSADRLEG